MGCGASSQAAPAAESEKAPWKRGVQIVENTDAKVIVARKRKNSVTRMSHNTQAAARRLYSEYRSGKMDDLEEGEEGEEESKALMKGGELTEAGLRKLLGRGVDEALFQFLFRLFDPDGSGTVNADEFVMTMGLITSECDSAAEQVEAIFVMFDTDETGVLSRDEFTQLIRATISLNLGSLLCDDKGQEVFEEQLRKEYSDENLSFWQAARAYTELELPEDRAAEAREIYETYIKDGAERQVNLPSGLQKSVTQGIEAAEETLFNAAAEEIFRLMERDTFKRFRDDPEAAEGLVDEFYRSTKQDPDGNVSLDAFREWAVAHPQVFVFFQTLSNTVRNLLVKKKSSASNQATPQPTPRQEDAAPAEEAACEATATEAPADETPAAEAAADDASAAEAAADEAPAEEPAADEAPATEPAADEAPEAEAA